MTRMKFKLCMIQALGYKDQVIAESTIDKFMDLNWDESVLFDWDYADFTEFADEVASNGFRDAVKNLDLICPNGC